LQYKQDQFEIVYPSVNNFSAIKITFDADHT